MNYRLFFNDTRLSVDVAKLLQCIFKPFLDITNYSSPFKNVILYRAKHTDVTLYEDYLPYLNKYNIETGCIIESDYKYFIFDFTKCSEKDFNSLIITLKVCDMYK